jgi:hypothetical protein
MIITSATSQKIEKKRKKKTCSGYEESGTGSAYFSGEIWLFIAKKLGNFCFSSVISTNFAFFFLGLNFAKLFI